MQRSMSTLFVLLVLALFTASSTGCFSTSYGASSRSYAKIPPAPSDSKLERWEHLCLALGKNTSKNLNEAGDEGWELVGFAPSGLACFKRPATDQ